MSFQSPLRDLILKIDEVAVGHLAYSQAADAIRNLRDHLSAIAYAEEINRDTGKTVVLALEPVQ
jgi:hypothetical protein